MSKSNQNDVTKEANRKCEICGGPEAVYQPPGGINRWYHYAHAHESELDAAHLLMLEFVDALLDDDTKKLFYSDQLDEMKQQLDREGWRNLCKDCGLRIPQ